MKSHWSAYGELAWTERYLADPDDLAEEVEEYVRLLRRSADVPLHTLLHLGCGAGAYDHTFRRHFTVTGVDVSPAMLDLARADHPDIEYIEGDMRSVRLGREFDAVVIPDAIDYMVTEEDLRSALGTAALHLRRGGVLLVVAKVAERFRDNNFAYSAERDGVSITLLENNHVDRSAPHGYEATLVYLIRRGGELEVHVDRHRLGLFPRQVWFQTCAAAGLEVAEHGLGDLYAPYLLGEGADYPMVAFVARRR